MCPIKRDTHPKFRPEHPNTGLLHLSNGIYVDKSDGKIDRIDSELVLEGDLTAEQRQHILEISNKCPVHRTLHSEIDVQTRIV